MAIFREQFNENYPRWAICQLSDPPKIMRKPVVVICESNCKHVFEKTQQVWNSNVCPIHGTLIHMKYEDEILEQAIQNWKREHEIKEIRADELAQEIFFPPEGTEVSTCTDLKAYLRYFEFTGRIPDLAKSIVRVSRGFEVAIPNLEERFPCDSSTFGTIRHLASEVRNILGVQESLFLEPRWTGSAVQHGCENRITAPQGVFF